MGYEIGDLWKKLGLRLNLELKIPDIDNQHEQQSEKAYQMLLKWKRRNAINATYIILYAALEIWLRNIVSRDREINAMTFGSPHGGK